MANPSVKIYENGDLPCGMKNPTVHVTGHNAEGKAIIHRSTQNPWRFVRNDTVGLSVSYTTTGFPIDMNDDNDLKAHEAVVQRGNLGLVNPNGSVCRYVDLGPGSVPTMHRTQSLDYGIVLEGVAELELDDGSVTVLQKGDLCVQRGTMHLWRNPSKTEWTRMLFVLQDSKPIMIGGTRYKEDLGTAKAHLPVSGNDN